MSIDESLAGTMEREGRTGDLPGVARLLHLVGAITCIATIVLVAVMQQASMSGAQLLVFYGLPMAAAVFFAVGVAAPPELRVNLLLVTMAFAVGLIAAELAIGVALPAPQRFTGVAEALGDPDTRSKLQVVADLRESGTHAFPEYSPWLLRGASAALGDSSLVPLAPAPARSTVVACNEGQGWLVYDTDEYGFRPPSPPPGETSVVVLGDSFVFGQCVGQEETLPGRLATQWPGTSNLGVSGAGPLHELAILREYGTESTPDVLVWVFFEGNDLADLSDELSSPLLSRYLEPGFRVGNPERNSDLGRWLSAKLDSVFLAQSSTMVAPPDNTTDASLAVRLLRTARLTRLRSAIGWPVRFPDPDPLGRLPEVVGTGRETVKSWGGQVLLVYLPDYSHFRFLGDEAFPQYKAFLGMAERLQLPVVDLVHAFRQTQDPRSLWVHPRGHLSTHGYDVAAGEVSRSVARLLR